MFPHLAPCPAGRPLPLAALKAHDAVQVAAGLVGPALLQSQVEAADVVVIWVLGVEVSAHVTPPGKGKDQVQGVKLVKVYR